MPFSLFGRRVPSGHDVMGTYTSGREDLRLDGGWTSILEQLYGWQTLVKWKDYVTLVPTTTYARHPWTSLETTGTERETKLTYLTILVGDGPAEFKLFLVMFPLTDCRQPEEFWVIQKQTKGSRLWSILISYLALYKCRIGGYFYFLETSPARRNRKRMSIGSMKA